jgi:hypothetical protein
MRLGDCGDDLMAFAAPRVSRRDKNAEQPKGSGDKEPYNVRYNIVQAAKQDDMTAHKPGIFRMSAAVSTFLRQALRLTAANLPAKLFYTTLSGVSR